MSFSIRQIGKLLGMIGRRMMAIPIHITFECLAVCWPARRPVRRAALVGRATWRVFRRDVRYHGDSIAAIDRQRKSQAPPRKQ